MAGFRDQSKSKEECARDIYEKQKNGVDLFNIAVKYHGRGDLVNAEKNYRQALENGFSHYAVFGNLGVICKNTDRPDEAILFYNKAIDLNPGYAQAFYNLGNLYKNIGSMEKALAFTLRALEFTPNCAKTYTNLCIIYRELGDSDQALAAISKSLEIEPNNPIALEFLGDIYFEKDALDEAERVYTELLKITQSNDRCLISIAACCFRRKDFNKSIEILNELVDEEKDTLITKEVGLKATIYEKRCAETICESQLSGGPLQSKGNPVALCKTSYRLVEDSLIKELYALEMIKISQLSQHTEARKGEGLCTDYNLFSRNSPNIQQLETDLRKIIRESLQKDVCSFTASFFNIFKNGSESIPHNHLRSYDKKFDLYKHKYSLVYYLDVGDQDCEQPGILKMHEPDFEVLPTKGLIVIIPATRMHSSSYSGAKDRLMVGVNFYAFS